MEKYLTSTSYRYNSNKKYEYFDSPTPDTNYIVDDSKFTPMSEAVKQLQKLQPLTEGQIKASYDFADGYDNGMKVPVNRLHNVSDITEIADAVKSGNDALNDVITSAKRKNHYDSIRNNINNTNTQNVTSNTTSTNNNSN